MTAPQHHHWPPLLQGLAQDRVNPPPQHPVGAQHRSGRHRLLRLQLTHPGATSQHQVTAGTVTPATTDREAIRLASDVLDPVGKMDRRPGVSLTALDDYLRQLTQKRRDLHQGHYLLRNLQPALYLGLIQALGKHPVAANAAKEIGNRRIGFDFVAQAIPLLQGGTALMHLQPAVEQLLQTAIAICSNEQTQGRGPESDDL